MATLIHLALTASLTPRGLLYNVLVLVFFVRVTLKLRFIATSFCVVVVVVVLKKPSGEGHPCVSKDYSGSIVNDTFISLIQSRRQ